MALIRGERVLGRPVSIAALAAVALLLAIGMAGQWWLDRWALGVAFDAYLGIARAAANAAVGLAVFLLLAGLTRRLLLSYVLVVVATVSLYLVSSIKYKMLGLPVMLQDMYFLKSVDLETLHLFSGYVDLSWRTACVGIGMLALLLALVFFEPAWCRRASAWRFAALGTGLALVVTMNLAVWPWTAGWYGRQAMRPSPLSAIPAVLHGGLVASLVHYNDEQRHRRFDVDSRTLKALVAKLDNPGARPASSSGPVPRDAPDIVIVLSESFMDPGVMNGLQDAGLIPNMRAAIAAGHGGMMVAPTFGGGTVRTEFEVLTGMPVEAFQGVYYPYVDLSVSEMPGLISELKGRGYASFALHGNAGSFWNRTSTYQAMGIDRFITQREMVRRGAFRDGGWIADQSMTDVLLDQLNQATRPTVAVAISIEAHGPYDSRVPILDQAAWSAIQVPAGLDDAARLQLRNYLYHLRNADRQLGRLVEGLRSRGRPFVLLFFGDHLPAFTGVYESLGFIDGRDAQKQYVPWLLISSDPAAQLPTLVHAWELPALLMEVAGFDDGSWFRFIRRVGEGMRSSPQAANDELYSNGLRAGANARLVDSFDQYAGPRRQ